MPYQICENCDIYHEISSKNETAESKPCDCGNKLKYYDSLEEYLQKRDNNKKPAEKVDLFPNLLNSYETAISKIVLCCVNELPFPLGISRITRVLKGSKSSFIIDHDLTRLDTYAAFSNFTRKGWKGISGRL